MIEGELKSQVSVEFAGIVALVLLIVLSIQLYFYYLEQQGMAIQSSYNARMIGGEVFTYFNLALITNGYNASFSIPSVVGSDVVNVSVAPGLLVVTAGGSTAAYPLTGVVELNSSGVLTQPPFNLSSGVHFISSFNGVVVVD